jgi:hypothetical protein
MIEHARVRQDINIPLLLVNRHAFALNSGHYDKAD